MAWSVDIRAIGFLPSDSGDPAWNWESVLNVCRRIEDWQGVQTARASESAMSRSVSCRRMRASRSSGNGPCGRCRPGRDEYSRTTSGRERHARRILVRSRGDRRILAWRRARPPNAEGRSALPQINRYIPVSRERSRRVDDPVVGWHSRLRRKTKIIPSGHPLPMRTPLIRHSSGASSDPQSRHLTLSEELVVQM
jgi:hypothetical protein